MGQVIGDVLPLALGIAISPAPMIAVILMLLSAGSRMAPAAFLLGWVLGIGSVVTVTALVVGPLDGSSSGEPAVWVSVTKIVLGCAALLLAFRQWRQRPRSGEEPAPPRWLAAMESVTVGRALGLGVLLAAANPKNLTLCLSGGVTIGGALSGSEIVIPLVVFVVLASCTVAAPVVGDLVARTALQGPLDEMRGWLTANNTALMASLLLIIGTVLIGKGLGGL